MSMMEMKLQEIKRRCDLKAIRAMQIAVLVLYGLVMYGVADAPGLKFLALLYLITAHLTSEEQLYNEYGRGLALSLGTVVGVFGVVMITVGLLSLEWIAIKYGLFISLNLVLMVFHKLADEEHRKHAEKVSAFGTMLIFAGIVFMAYVLDDFSLKLFLL